MTPVSELSLPLRNLEALLLSHRTVLVHFLDAGLRLCTTVEQKRQWIDSCARDTKEFYADLGRIIFAKEKAAPPGAA